jgi:hypothetical protein
LKNQLKVFGAGAAGTGDRGSSISGSGGVDVASLVTSVTPLLHHLAEALQNGTPPPPPPPPQVLFKVFLLYC